MISTDPFEGNDQGATSAYDASSNAGYGLGFRRRASAVTPDDQVRIYRQHR